MNLTIPIYAEKQGGVFMLKPLFRSEPTARSRDLSRATTTLTVELIKELNRLSKMDRHDELADLSFAPDLEERGANLTLHLRRHTLHLKLMLVVFRKLGRRIAFSPQLEDLWFAVERSQDLIVPSRTTISADGLLVPVPPPSSHSLIPGAIRGMTRG